MSIAPDLVIINPPLQSVVFIKEGNKNDQQMIEMTFTDLGLTIMIHWSSHQPPCLEGFDGIYNGSV